MSISPDSPPAGTVRDWLEKRANLGGIAFVFPKTGTTVDWSTLRTEAQVFAATLTRRGVTKGESVAIVSPNDREALVALYGALVGGFRATMINLSAGRDAISYALDHSGARFAFVHSECAELFDAANATGIIQIVPERGTVADLHDITADDHALLMYTSGTTGRPKGVLHSHASLLAGGWTTAIAHDLGAQDRSENQPTNLKTARERHDKHAASLYFSWTSVHRPAGKLLYVMSRNLTILPQRRTKCLARDGAGCYHFNRHSRRQHRWSPSCK